MTCCVELFVRLVLLAVGDDFACYDLVCLVF